jgi:HNH endonuclease
MRRTLRSPEAAAVDCAVIRPVERLLDHRGWRTEVRPTCTICGRDIAPADDSDEHIHPAAIGGRRTVRGFLHSACNHRSGHTWDAALEKQLRPLSLHFGVKRQSGRTSRMPITTTAGENLLLNTSGQLEMSRPTIKRTPIPNGETIQVTAGSMTQAREVLEGVKRKSPKVDVEAVLAGAESRRSYPTGVVRIDLDFGGPTSGRSLVKSALALARGRPPDRALRRRVGLSA